MDFPTIKTDRFLLRQFTDGDLENLFRGLSHPDVVPYYGVNFSTLEEAKEHLKWLAELEKTGTGIWWAICSADNSTFMGAGGLNRISPVHKKAELSYWSLPAFWRQGVMTETVPLICRYGFDVLGLHRVESFVESENQRCQKAVAKLGFTYEGTMTDCETKHGRFISLGIYAMFNE